MMKYLGLICAACGLVWAAMADPVGVSGWDVEPDIYDDHIYTSVTYPDQKIVLSYGVPGYWAQAGIELDSVHNMSSRANAFSAGCEHDMLDGFKVRRHYKAQTENCLTLIGLGPRAQPIMLVAIGSEDGAFKTAQALFAKVVYGD